MPSPRTLWGVGYGECTTCRSDGDPAWTCPAALSAYYQIGGTDADIVETDGGTGKQKREHRPLDPLDVRQGRASAGSNILFRCFTRHRK